MPLAAVCACIQRRRTCVQPTVAAARKSRIERTHYALCRRRRRPPLLRVHRSRGRSADPPVRRLSIWPRELRCRQRRLPRELPPAELRRQRLRALDAAADRLHDRGLGRRGRRPARRPRNRARAHPRDLDGRHDLARVHREIPETRRSPAARTARSPAATSTGATMFRNWRQQCEALPLDDFCACSRSRPSAPGFSRRIPTSSTT